MELFALGNGVDVKARGMAVSAVLDKPFSLCHSVLKVLGAVHCKHGRKLFMREFLGKLNAVNLADKNLCGFGNGDSG